MKTYTDEQVTKTVRHVTGTFCDWCGASIPGERTYDVREFTLSFESGYAYPEGGEKKGWRVEDLCDNCVAKLRTLIEKAGIKTVDTEVDW